jgi:hypothetical protein
MSVSLSGRQKEVLSKYEKKFQIACRSVNLTEAEQLLKKIQLAFSGNPNHFRLLKAKNWYYEALLDAGKNFEALLGFEMVKKRANEGTRLYLETTILYSVCLLRTGKIDEAKQEIRFVVSNLQNIKSQARRIQFEKRLIQRVEDECILSQLIENHDVSFDVDFIHQKAIEAVKKTDDEIFEMIADSLPSSTVGIFNNVRDFSIKLLPASDQMLLEAPKNIPKVELGKKAASVLKRIGWKSFCDENSEIYKLWNNRIPKVFNQGYFALAVTTTFKDWKIGLPSLAIGVVATAMKYGCQEFCERFKPSGLIIPINEKD